MEKTIVELFAGVGGFRLAFENHLKWETLWANQWEPK
jgi:DNA (cytosine-5)-methyltransferase 1